MIIFCSYALDMQMIFTKVNVILGINRIHELLHLTHTRAYKAYSLRVFVVVSTNLCVTLLKQFNSNASSMKWMGMKPTNCR
jgi:hypothetical protein